MKSTTKLEVTAMQVVVPEALDAADEILPAVRTPDKLKMTWGFIDTSKVNADAFIEDLRTAVRERHGVESIVVHKAKPGVGLTEEEERDLATTCGVVVECFGD